MSTSSRSKRSLGPILWPLGLVGVGVILLLSNFLLLGDFAVVDLWPLLLVVLGLQILLRGDVVPDDSSTPFAITRGSVESASLEINAAEIDVQIGSTDQTSSDRLIAGQFARKSRPTLEVDDTHAHLRMARSQTPWLSFTNWDAYLSPDLAWQIVVGTNLGQITLDLSDINVRNVLASTGFGAIQITLPQQAEEAIYLRSLLGSITVQAPPDTNVRIRIEGSRMFTVQADETRYDQIEAGLYRTYATEHDDQMIDVVIAGTFGDAYLT